MTGKSNFIKDHYEWIVAGVALAALAGAIVLFLGANGVDPDDMTRENLNAVARMTPGGTPVVKADLTDFVRTAKIAKDPTSLSEVTDDKASFLAAEGRMFCTNCQALVVKDVKTCPKCQAVLAEVKVEETDADRDGMPNDWEKKYGFNPNDPSDATTDKDGDGFTNLEEYEAKTDPTDANDHPDYLDSLSVRLPLKETVLPFYFTGTYKTPSGVKYQFKDPSRAKEYDRGNYSLLAGEAIGKTGFAPKELVVKSVEKTMGGGMKKKVDVSEVIVVRKSDGKKVAMAMGRKGVPVDVQATLVYSRDGGKTFAVVVGDTIEVSGNAYVVKDIKRVQKGAQVTLEHKKLGKIRILSALEQ